MCRQVFLHGWRRHVCRECTGHLVLLEGESSARGRKPTPTKTKHKQTTKQTNNQPGQDATQVGHAEVKQNKRGETRGVKLSKTASQCTLYKMCMSRQFKGQAAVLRSVAVPLRTTCSAVYWAWISRLHICVCSLLIWRGIDNPTGWVAKCECGW